MTTTRPKPRRVRAALAVERLEDRSLLSAGLEGMYPLANPIPGNSLVLRMEDGATPEQLQATLQTVHGFVSDTHSSGSILVVVGQGIDVEGAVLRLNGRAGVAYAEQNHALIHTGYPTDTYYTNGQLWGMYGESSSPANPFGSGAAEAWNLGKVGSSSVLVGVIDEGIQVTHPDLDANLWVNPFDPVDGVDNDGNGYVDDVHGWDFANNDRTVYDGGTRGRQDDHGTHVAGTIGAEANGTGVVGVNHAIKMISAKFLGPSGGTTANAIKAVDYLTDLKTRHGLNLVATNNSWGGGGYSQGLFDAISRANTAGILFIAAAGNSGKNIDSAPSYPAAYNLPNVIAVAAITSTGALASYSNYGATNVDLGAPGSGIVSTTAFNTYSSYSGTSMATPHVTGAAALYASLNPKLESETPEQYAARIKTAILTTVTPTPSLAGKTVTAGRLDIGRLINGT